MTGCPTVGRDCRGVPVSTTDTRLLDLLDSAHAQSLCFAGDPIATIDAALAERPDFVMGHVFKAAMLTQSMERGAAPPLRRHLEAAEALSNSATGRERGHMAAIRAWSEGDFLGAVRLWEQVVAAHPFDLLALQLVHLSAVLLGEVARQRDSVARVFPLWDETVPGYEHVLGFYAFGLEETGDFGRAEELGRQAIALRPDHPYAVHAVAHVMEMGGRQAGGIRFMAERRPVWEGSTFANHLWWHLALFHLDLGQDDRVLQIYDQNLRGSAGAPADAADRFVDLDSAALLWRLQLLGVDVGSRWADLAARWAPAATDTLYAFNDVHAMMAFVGAGRGDLQDRLLTANARYLEHATEGSVCACNAGMSREIGLPFGRALQDFAAGRYRCCVDRLLPLRYGTHRLGGSHAQRDIVAWTLLEAALRAGDGDLALALANERCQQKPTSPQNWRFTARAHTLRGDTLRAERAEAKAGELLAA